MPSYLLVDLPFQCSGSTQYAKLRAQELGTQASWLKPHEVGPECGPRYTNSTEGLKLGQGASCGVLRLQNCRAVKALLPPPSQDQFHRALLQNFRVWVTDRHKFPDFQASLPLGGRPQPHSSDCHLARAGRI